jgi:hypothetical protein
MINYPLRILFLSEYDSMRAGAKDIGIDHTAVSAIIRGRRKPTQDQLKKLRKRFGYYQVAQAFPEYRKTPGVVAVESVRGRRIAIIKI